MDGYQTATVPVSSFVHCRTKIPLHTDEIYVKTTTGLQSKKTIPLFANYIKSTFLSKTSKILQHDHEFRLIKMALNRQKSDGTLKEECRTKCFVKKPTIKNIID